MHCSHIGLTNFRNFSRLEIDLPPGISIFCGDNAQGKTNFLESIYFLATTKSPRTSVDRELLNWLALQEEMPVSRIVGDVRKSESAVKVEIAVASKEDKGVSPGYIRQFNGNGAVSSISKRIKVNGVAQRASDLIGLVNVVMFSPEDIELVAGPPGQRRRYLDITNSQVDHRYLYSLQQYNKVLAQRNHLLRFIREHRAKVDQLFYWDKQLVETGSYVLLQRLRMVAEFNELVRDIHPTLTESQERMSLTYLASIGSNDSPCLDSEDFDEVRLQNLFTETLEESQGKEIALGMSLAGPHRDDIKFFVDQIDMNTYGSRGQQRSVALSLKLAETRYMLAASREYPILLLDDIMSELDSDRRQRVLNAVSENQQVLMTTTDLHHFQPELLARSSLFSVSAGRVEKFAN
ncbi:MAG: DNA replication/repair protein RecF [Candidatus Marsarchaeota archaeon]|nr:DNA replication/repair protein RecF [Candidatus Marsarchaeota archaeon]